MHDAAAYTFGNLYLKVFIGRIRGLGQVEIGLSEIVGRNLVFAHVLLVVEQHPSVSFSGSMVWVREIASIDFIRLPVPARETLRVVGCHQTIVGRCDGLLCLEDNVGEASLVVVAPLCGRVAVEQGRRIFGGGIAFCGVEHLIGGFDGSLSQVVGVFLDQLTQEGSLVVYGVIAQCLLLHDVGEGSIGVLAAWPSVGVQIVADDFHAFAAQLSVLVESASDGHGVGIALVDEGRLGDVGLRLFQRVHGIAYLGAVCRSLQGGDSLVVGILVGLIGSNAQVIGFVVVEIALLFGFEIAGCAQCQLRHLRVSLSHIGRHDNLEILEGSGNSFRHIQDGFLVVVGGQDVRADVRLVVDKHPSLSIRLSVSIAGEVAAIDLPVTPVASRVLLSVIARYHRIEGGRKGTV